MKSNAERPATRRRTLVSLALLALTLCIAAPAAAQDGSRIERIQDRLANQAERQARRGEEQEDRQERREERREDRRDDRRDNRQDNSRENRQDNSRENRQDNSRENRQDNRDDNRQERRDDRRDTYQGRRDDRQERRDDRREFRQDRRDDRHEFRQDRREHLARERARQAYYDRLRNQQRYWTTIRYHRSSDPYFNTPWSHRYSLGGRYYQTNRYGVDLIRQAAQHGYAEGVRAGQADRYDGWRFDYRDSWAYRDGGYGYDGRYIDRGHYAHYFREGFRRGYEDGYYGQRRYGRYDNNAGQYLMVGAILATILNITTN